jgi:hypothetical protein
LGCDLNTGPSGRTDNHWTAVFGKKYQHGNNTDTGMLNGKPKIHVPLIKMGNSKETKSYILMGS